MSDADCISAEVDFGTVTGYFVRLDVELPSDALYDDRRKDGGPMGWLALTADEAERLAHALLDRAERVRTQTR